MIIPMTRGPAGVRQTGPTPQPSETNLLMALAIMHEGGRLPAQPLVEAPPAEPKRG